MHALAANDSRYISRDELRYSLRSVDMYADWVRHVYLVTDNQVPPWLEWNPAQLTAKINAVPAPEDVPFEVNMNLIIEFYR